MEITQSTFDERGKIILKTGKYVYIYFIKIILKN